MLVLLLLLLLGSEHLLFELYCSSDHWDLALADVWIVTIIASELLTIELVNLYAEVKVLTPVLTKFELSQLQWQGLHVTLDHFCEISYRHPEVDFVASFLVPGNGHTRILPRIIFEEEDEQGVLLGTWILNFLIELLHLRLLAIWVL